MRGGIAFSEDNRTMQDGRWQYDSAKPKLTVATQQVPPHLQVFNLDGGTQWGINHGDSKTETLFQMKHKLPFAPMFLCYFYTTDAPAAFAGDIGLYSLNYAQMRYNGDTWFEELYAMVDATNFYIKHHVGYVGGTDAGAQTSYGSQYKFRVRFEIIARQAVNLGGPGF